MTEAEDLKRLLPPEAIRENCTLCNGVGRTGPARCPICRGTGRQARDAYAPESAVDAPSAEEREIDSLRKRVAELEKQKDGAYSERNKLVALVGRMAIELGYGAGLGKHPDADTAWEDDWRNVVFVMLPTGQCTWHIHDSELPIFSGLPRQWWVWDGHTTEEKYERVLSAAEEWFP